MDMTLFYKIAGLMVFAYLLGSIPWGLVFTRAFTSVNIMEQGSGNIGATNVKRLAGTHWGLLTLAGDVLKGLIPVLLACSILGAENIHAQWVVILAAFSAFLGHLFPVYLKLKKGGKGVATTFGCFLAISPWACMICLLVFIAMVYFSGRASVGSLSASAVLPLAIWITGEPALFALFAVVFSIMIFWRHKENIKRLVNGSEPEIL